MSHALMSHVVVIHVVVIHVVVIHVVKCSAAESYVQGIAQWIVRSE